MDVTNLIWKAGLRRGLSVRTIRTYVYTVNKFLRIYRKEPFNVKKKDIEEHLHRLLEQDRGGSTLNVHLCALKFFYEKVLHRRLTIDILFFRERKRLPVVLTKEEISVFFKCLKNRKHRLIVTLIYSAGLRVSEAVNLRVKDLFLEEGYGWVRQGKGGKDRIFIIAQKLNHELKEWIIEEKISGEDCLFKGQGDFPYSTQSVRQIIKTAKRQAGINKNITPHTLRHSFATHLAENGYSILEIQPLLGHKSIETTMIYTHLAAPKLLNVKSPYDNLNLHDELYQKH